MTSGGRRCPFHTAPAEAVRKSSYDWLGEGPSESRFMSSLSLAHALHRSKLDGVPTSDSELTEGIMISAP
jgi:hypothetical protein